AEVMMMAETSRLPAPVAEIWEWQRHGNCRNMDSAVFFHPDGERGLAREKRVARAKEICRSCTVIAECRRHARPAQEPVRVWGGLDETEGREVGEDGRTHPEVGGASSVHLRWAA